MPKPQVCGPSISSSPSSLPWILALRSPSTSTGPFFAALAITVSSASNISALSRSVRLLWGMYAVTRVIILGAKSKPTVIIRPTSSSWNPVMIGRTSLRITKPTPPCSTLSPPCPCRTYVRSPTTYCVVSATLVSCRQSTAMFLSSIYLSTCLCIPAFLIERVLSVANFIVWPYATLCAAALTGA